ncbi:MAG: ECF transporter S component [Clostridia bacterium]|nr:ECF transporter S component [Clostridia bacterium]
MKTNIRKLSVTALLAAVSSVLMFINFAVPMFMPPFIKLDFSELPALLGSFALGPVYGVLVSLIKNLINLPFTTTGGVGELSNFIISTSFVFVAGLIYKKFKNRTGALIGSVAGALAAALLSIFTNFYITYPFYTNFMPMDAIIGMYQAINSNINSLIEALIWFNMPFTFVKCMCSVVISFIIYKKISPILKG